MPDSAVPVVRRPVVRRLPSSSSSKESPELRRLSLGEVSSTSSRGSSAEKEGNGGGGRAGQGQGTGGGGATVAGPRVLLRRSVKVKTKEETALQRIMRDDDLPPPFPVSTRDFPVSPLDPSTSSSLLPTRGSPAAPTKSRRRVAKTCVSL